MANRSYDAVVIGGGPAGYSCAIRLGQLKKKVACVEKDEVGGVCLNWGCIPSKALIAASHLYEKAQHSGSMGIKISKIELDVNAMQDWKGGIVKKLTGGVRGLLKGNGADLIVGTAFLTSPTVPIRALGRADAAHAPGAHFHPEARGVGGRRTDVDARSAQARR